MNYDANKRMMWRMMVKILAVGIAFLALSFFWPDAMSPNVYGAQAHAVPAEVWALGFIAAPGLVIFGLHINGRKPRLTPLLRLVGITFLFGQYAYLAVSAMGAPDGEAIVIFSVLFFAPDLVYFARVETRQLIARWGALRNDD